MLIFFSALIGSFLVMNAVYKYLLAPLFGLVGVFLFNLLMPIEGVEAKQEAMNFSSLLMPTLISLQLIAGVFWLLVPSSTTLFYSDWSQMPSLLVFRGVVLVIYSLFVPGILLAYLLDIHGQLSLLEIGVLGYLLSVFISSSVGYLIIASHIDLSGEMFPTIWLIVTLMLGGTVLAKRFKAPWVGDVRTPSFPSRAARNLVVSVVTFLLAAVLVINVSWHVLLGGDLWTHAAQTAYYLQGQPTALYPWTFHFLAASIHAISGLPVVNAIQLLQFLAVMPILALYVTVAALVGHGDSKIPAIATLFFAIFMGLGWSSYLYIITAFHPIGSSAIYGAESIASELTYDILLGVAGFRVVLDPAIIALTALIYALRFLGGFGLPRRLLFLSSFIAGVIMIQSHLLEAGLFTGVLAASVIFFWDVDRRNVLTTCTIASASGFAWAYLVDYLSPPSLQILAPFPGNFYYSGFEYALAPLLLALPIIGVKITLTGRWLAVLDGPNYLYRRLELKFDRFERPLLKIFILACIALGVVFGLITFVNQPFFAWETGDTGVVPWNYYPIRIGIVTLFALWGSITLLFHRDDFHRFFQFLSLATIAIIVGRLTYFFGLRPQGFGENRVMDFLWLGAVVLGAYGFVRVVPPFLEWLGSTRAKQELVGAMLIILILLTGASSFLVFVDAYVNNSATPGLVPTSSDMLVVNYVIGHRDSVGFILTAPTFETQYWLRKLTLDPPYGYNLPFVTPSLFTSTTLSGFLGQMSAYSGLRVLLTAHDTNYLENSGYMLSRWYLGFQPTVVDAGSSFLIASRPLVLPSGGSITAITAQQPTQQDFFLVSSFGLARTPYLLDTLGRIVSAGTPNAVLSDDPFSNSTYSSALSWVQATRGTLIVVSNMDNPGLFESKFFSNHDENNTFSAVRLVGSIGGTYSYDVPIPFTVHLRQATNATILSQYQGTSVSSPLSYEKTLGPGRIILLMLRDYFTFLSLRMFSQDGRVSYSVLPFFLRAAGVPIAP